MSLDPTKPLPSLPTESTTRPSEAPPSVPKHLGLSTGGHVFPFRYATNHITGPGVDLSLYDPSIHVRVQELSRFYAKVSFTSLRVIINPNYTLLNSAQTVTAVWSHSDLVPTALSIGSIPGAVTTTFGGAFSLSKPVEVVCPCDAMVCIVKDLVQYRYQPRFFVSATPAFPDPPNIAPVTIQMHIEGTLLCEKPIMTSWFA